MSFMDMHTGMFTDDIHTHPHTFKFMVFVSF